MQEVDLSKEPIAIVVAEDPKTKRTSFADVVERIIPALEKKYGAARIQAAIAPSDAAKKFFMSLEEEAPREPRFLTLHKSGELKKRVQKIEANGPLTQQVSYFMAAINRSDEAVFGRTGVLYFVCRKGCHFCQYRNLKEHQLDAEGIAARMLAFQKAGADNVQLLSPTAYHRTLVKAIAIAAENGFSLPIVHKSEAEDPPGDLSLLDGLIDIYVPDVKFLTPEFASVIGLTTSYPERVKTSVTEMVRQVGRLKRKQGTMLAQSGVFVRHLLMPTGLRELELALEFIRGINANLPVNIMTGYQPYHEAAKRSDINRMLTAQEKAEASRIAYNAEMPFLLMS